MNANATGCGHLDGFPKELHKLLKHILSKSIAMIVKEKLSAQSVSEFQLYLQGRGTTLNYIFCLHASVKCLPKARKLSETAIDGLPSDRIQQAFQFYPRLPKANY